MLVAVVVAHPREDSFCVELARRVTIGLRAAGHDVEVLDLYRCGFRAAMSAPERSAYHGEQPLLDPIVARHAELITSAAAVVFVYPTWWGGLPAMLKGWLERVLVPGVAFRFDERTEKVRPALGNIRRIIGVSTYGSPRWAVWSANDNGRRTLTRALRVSCGWRTTSTWLGCYAVDTSSQRDREEFGARVEREMADLCPR